MVIYPLHVGCTSQSLIQSSKVVTLRNGIPLVAYFISKTSYSATHASVVVYGSVEVEVAVVVVDVVVVVG